MTTVGTHCARALSALLLGLLGLLGGCGGSGAASLVGTPGEDGSTDSLSVPIWYVIADAGGGGGGNDRLFSVDITLAAPAHNQTAIGAGTGTNNIEGAAFWPGSDTLYAFDSARLGTIHLTTGVWAAVGTKDVWDDGGAVNISGLDKNRNPETLARTVLDDIDSLAFDPNTGVAYGVDRQTGADLLIVINPATGLLVRGAFTVGGTSYDFIRVPPVEAGNEDIDDIAVDPYDGQLYGIANGGGFSDRVVRIDKHTGVSSDVGLLGVDDMEGFAFYNDGTMWGTTGGGSATVADRNALYSINTLSGLAFDRRPLGLGGSDYESITFLTGDLNTFCGRVYCDTDGSGAQNGAEPGTPGVEVILWRDINNNDLLDATIDIPLVSTTTDALGDYCFRVASNGDYVITVLPSTLPADFVLDMPNVLAATAGGFGATQNGLDFRKRGTTGSLGDSIWLDSDQDGVQDPLEPGLRGVTVNLLDPGGDAVCGTADDVLLATAVTDGGGYYLFPGNADGAYCVDVDETTLPPGATLTTANEPHAATILLASNDLSADFGYFVPARLGDRVWLDVDGDGVQDAGEPGLGGIDVFAARPGPDGFFGTADDVPVGTVTTAADGSYLLGGLAPGSYQITVDVNDAPTGATLSSNANPIRVWLVAGQDFQDADFGFVGNGSIGDLVWNDTNGDGGVGGAEPRLGGVTLALTESGPDGTLGTADDVSLPPQVTAGDGSYSFTGLPPGLYRVDVDESTLPAGLRSLTTAAEPLDVALVAGADITTADFGYMTNSASIGDRVWDDRNNDGVQDAGEPGLVGVTIRLSQAGPDGTLGTGDDVVLPPTDTVANGAYDFTGLQNGLYRVDVDETTLPAGVVSTTANEPDDVTLGAGQDYNAADFGYRTPASLGDRVWNDLNGNGAQDAGEPGLVGVTVTLVEAGPDGTLGTADDVSNGSQATVADGAYLFTGLIPGLYRVDVSNATLPAGMQSTTLNDPLDQAILAGQQYSDADFGFWNPASIGDLVWNDVDGNGVKGATEPGLGSVTVTLTSAGPDGTLGTADDVAFPNATTAPSGAYSFGSLPAGLYRVAVDGTSLPAGFGLTTGNVPLTVPLVAGQNVTNADFGYWVSASVGDRVWVDSNADGMQDAGELGLGGIDVSLVGAGPDTLFGTGDDLSFPNATTAPDGGYGFAGLPPGTYRVDVVNASVPAGMALTSANDPTTLVLAAGETNNAVDFGYRHTARIGDRIWDDLNGDGVQDPGEPGLGGITVTLASAGPDGICGTADDGAPPSTTPTNALGAYAFPNLPAGVYCVLVDGATVPAGYVPTTGVGIVTVTLTPGQDHTTADFGFRRTGAIGDRVWHDVDGDGVQDAGEPGLVGVTVNLLEAGPDSTFGTADDVTFPAEVTVADGAYMFNGLSAGTYRVTVDGTSAPAGMQSTNAASLDITLAAGAGNANADFGFRHVASIGDFVWQDLDADGVQDPGEPGLGGVRIDLVEAGPDGLFATADDVAFPAATTAPSGAYGFANLAPGLYRVTPDGSTLPVGMQTTTGNAPLTVPLAPAQNFAAADFGYDFAGSIGDLVWEDQDGDMARGGGEPALVGVRLLLVEAGGDGTLGTADDVAFPDALTAGDGSYSFVRLPPGTYRVTVDPTTVGTGLLLTTGNLPFDTVIVGAGTVTDGDFGYRASASIGDRVWNDVDGDGVQDAAEVGINGVTLRLLEAGADGVLGTADDVSLPNTITAGDGDYGFSNLPAGLYRVSVDAATVPAGMTLTSASASSDVTLAAGQADTVRDFGYRFDASIGDRLWNDLDGDGVQDVGEPGLDGVRLDLLEAGPDGVLGTPDDVTFPAAVTAGGGMYGFVGLPPGLYRVTVDPTSVPAGMLLTTANQPLDVTLAPSEVVVTADFGFRHSALIGDYVWLDANADGMQDASEAGLDGVRLVLTEAGVDGTIGTADDVAYGSQTTAGGGAYTFGNLPSGVYRVQVDATTLPAGVALSTAAEPIFLTLASGQQERTADFGYRHTASIGDRVWEDLNGDGVQDPGESGLNGVTVRALEAGPDGVLGTGDDVVLAATTTAGDGAYTFTNLPAGRYRMTVDAGTVPVGMAATTANPPTDVVLTAGEMVTNVDVGFRHPGSIGDRVWDDVSRNGLQDAGEPGLGGVLLTLTEAGPDGTLGTADDVAVRTTTSAADGSYSFPGLPAGRYRVDPDGTTAPAGFTLTTTDPVDLTLVAGEMRTDVDFGYASPLYTVGDVIWIDANRNGLYEPELGERPVPGVSITVFDTNGAVVATDTTNAAGEYRVNIPAGTFRVEVDAGNFAPGAPLHGTTESGLGVSVTATVSADRFDLDFPFLLANAQAAQFCSWWQTNTAAWPLTTMTLGGQTYSQADAMQLLSQGNDIAASLTGRAAARVMATADMSVLVAWALIGAKLNVASGVNPTGVEVTIRAADAWLASVGIGSRVVNGTAQYARAQELYQALGNFNGDL